MPQTATVADSHTTDSSAAERMTQIALLLATRGVPLARMALKRTGARKDARAEAEAFDPDLDNATQGALARATGRLARAVNAVGATIYDYSNGEYGIKPLDPKELRHARKEAQKKLRDRARYGHHNRVDASITQPRKRGRAKWVFLGLGALVVAGAAAVVILQREQVRAATNQLLGQGRQTMRQLQARGSLQAQPVLADGPGA